MKFKTGQTVLILKGTDDTANNRYEDTIATIVGTNTNGATGNSREDPLYECRTYDGATESYWEEELSLFKLHTGYYIQLIWRDVEFKLFGPFQSNGHRALALKPLVLSQDIRPADDSVLFQTLDLDSGNVIEYRKIDDSVIEALSIDYLELAKGNTQYAKLLEQRSKQNEVHPATIVDEDLREGEIIEFNNQYLMTGGMDVQLKFEPEDV